MRESSIEKRLRVGVKAAGGLCEKFKSPQRNGVPDRIVTWPGGVMELVETKAPNGNLSKGQERDHARRRKLGVLVWTLWTSEHVDYYLRRGNP